MSDNRKLQDHVNFRAIFENALSGMAICHLIYNDQNKIIDWIIDNVNASFEKMTGQTAQQVIGVPASERLAGIHQTNPRLLEMLERVSLTGYSERIEEYVSQLRAWFDVMVYSSEPDKFVFVFDNITDRKQAQAELTESHMKITRAYDDTVDIWSKTLDLRDHETEGHSQRVTNLGIQLMRHLNYYVSDMKSVRYGMLLHDIGKMGVPESILYKKGALSDHEWREMKRHPEIAYEMLKQNKHLEKSIDIPYCHHERWDGTGYPRGLKGAEIPMEARIFAVVDTWDALTNDRVYRKAIEPAEALDIIERGAGSQFDPIVAQKFMEMMKQELI